MMETSVQDTGLEKLVIVGDRILIKPTSQNEKTASGLFLPPGVTEKEKVRTGYVMKTGPGYPIPLPIDETAEPWKEADEQIRYVPLQVKPGDLAIFLQKEAVEINYQNQKYYVVAQHAILMVERDEGLFD